MRSLHGRDKATESKNKLPGLFCATIGGTIVMLLCRKHVVNLEPPVSYTLERSAS